MDQDTHQTQPDTPVVDDLPADYPFDLDRHQYTGLLTGAEAMIYSEARDYARDDLQASDFEREPEYEEDELNYQLTELREAVTEVYGELTRPGPWRGIAEGDDVPKAIAEIKALVNKLLVPATSVEDAIVEARVSGLERQRGTRKVVEGRRWRERLDFENRVAEAIREAGWDGRPLEYRLACMDQLIGDAQRYRATIAREHHHDAWMASQADD